MELDRFAALSKKKSWKWWGIGKGLLTDHSIFTWFIDLGICQLHYSLLMNQLTSEKDAKFGPNFILDKKYKKESSKPKN